MTLAIGIACTDGVVLCADTLVTTGTLGSFESKIHGYRFRGGDVMFAIAGNVPYADNAIDSCEGTLRGLPSTPSRAQILDAIRPVLAAEYRNHIIESRYEGSIYDYSLLVAVRSIHERSGLYFSCGTILKKAKRGVECIGSGSDLGRYLITQAFNGKVQMDEAWDLAAYAMGTVKNEMPGNVGGDTLILSIPSHEDPFFSGYMEVQLAEKYARLFNRSVSRMRAHFMFLDDDNEFDPVLKTVGAELSDLRDRWKKERAPHARPPFPPLLAQDAIVDLR